MGLEMQTSAYANLWIKSQAFLAIGDYDMAFNIIGEHGCLSLSGSHRPFRPGSGTTWDWWRSWRATRTPTSITPSATSRASTTKYYPAGAFSMGPMVLDVPDARMPCYTSFGNRFHIAGSPFSYIAVQMNQMAMGIFRGTEDAGGPAGLAVLDIAERRNIRPDVCRALRGRIYYSLDDFKGAHTELKAAREAFRKKGEVDAGTSLLLGMLELQSARYQHAARYMEESVKKDPKSAVGWRSLGVVYANLGLRERAIGRHGRGTGHPAVFRFRACTTGVCTTTRNQDYLAAVADLDRALRSNPTTAKSSACCGWRARATWRWAAVWPTCPDLTGNYDYDVETGETVTRMEVDPEQLLAQLEADIEGFFTVPDSLAQKVADSDEAVAELEERYFREGDLRARKILALGYIDRKELAKAQALLAPGWGVDLEPDEEIMLLYADRMLGEQERARQLADQLAAGQASTENPYVWAMMALTIRDDPRAADFSYVNAAFLSKNYSDASEYSTSVLRTGSFYMLNGFSNVRASFITPEGDALPIENKWIRQIQGAESAGPEGYRQVGRSSGPAKDFQLVTEGAAFHRFGKGVETAGKFQAGPLDQVPPLLLVVGAQVVGVVEVFGAAGAGDRQVADHRLGAGGRAGFRRQVVHQLADPARSARALHRSSSGIRLS